MGARTAEHHRGVQTRDEAAGDQGAEERDPEDAADLPGRVEDGGRGATAPHGHQELSAFGVDPDRLPRRRTGVRYCVDGAEQRHHLAGALGAALTARMFALEWLRHGRYRRVVHLTDGGREGLATTFGVDVDQVF
ncbi:hypothetical protein [Streptomyces lydicus]|uniref:hypothetical protein n=1 Tax=Streptomyces lydicus TaxID=47763 RepID=UPI0036F9B19E